MASAQHRYYVQNSSLSSKVTDLLCSFRSRFHIQAEVEAEVTSLVTDTIVDP